MTGAGMVINPVRGIIMTESCHIVDMSNVKVIEHQPELPLKDYIAAMELAANMARKEAHAAGFEEIMLLSWYDRDRDFESPQHASECHADSAIPGYVDYGVYHGAQLKIDIEQGRFVFFYLFL